MLSFHLLFPYCHLIIYSKLINRSTSFLLSFLMLFEKMHSFLALLSMEMSLMKSVQQLLSPLAYISQILHRNRDQKELHSCKWNEQEWQDVSEKGFECGFSRCLQRCKSNSMNFCLVRDQRVYTAKTITTSVWTFNQSSHTRG